jgi:aspartate racemase
MKLVGVIGGMGPESTIEYYRAFMSVYRARVNDGSYPRLVILSIDVSRVLNLAATSRLDELAADLVQDVSRLAAAGAEVAMLAANTPHIVFDRVQKEVPLPMISIVECCCDVARARGLRKLALFGTRSTMQGGFYEAVLARQGIDVITPSRDDQKVIHDIYVNELLHRDGRPASRAAVLGILERMKAGDGIDGLILGGTELPLLLTESEYAGVPVLDTCRIHVEAAVSMMLGQS